MDINTFIQNYKDQPLNRIIEYIDTDILETMHLTINFSEFLKLKDDYLDGTYKFSSIIKGLSPKQQQSICNNVNKILFKEQNIKGNTNQCSIYNTLVYILNIILLNQNLSKITNATDLKNIPSSAFTNGKIIELFDKNESEIFKCIDRAGYKWGTRYKRRVKYNDYGYALTLVRDLCKKLELNFVGLNKRNDKGIVERHYSIVC